MSNSELKKIAEKKTAQIVKSELDKKAYEDVAWLKALKKAEGNEDKAKALYIDLRSSDLIEEVYLSLKEDQKNRLKRGLNNDDEVDVDYSIKDGFKFKKKEDLPLTAYEKKQIKQKQIQELKEIKSIYSPPNLDKNQLNILLFSIIYFFSFFLGYYLIDLDLNFQNLLGHRSIITHSILIPWLIYFYSKDKTSKYFFTIIMGLFISCSVHLINDLIPKGWSGYAFIKLPGNISLGFLSIPWIFLNALVAMYLGQKILFNYFSKTKYKVLIIIITIITSFLFALNDRNDEMLKFILFLIVFFSFYFYQRVRTLPLA